MDFRIADSFTDCLCRLTGDEQKAVKTTAFDLQMNPASPGLSFHKLDRAKDKNFWSVRVSADIRLIVHRTQGSLLLCYVDHHDEAYKWAGRRKLEIHPKTRAAQLVEIRETVKEVVVPIYVQEERPAPWKRSLFADKSNAELLSYGVPDDWLDDVRQATEDGLLVLAERLPAEAAEALLELATGGTPRVVKPLTAVADPFDHPDAQRRFRVMTECLWSGFAGDESRASLALEISHCLSETSGPSSRGLPILSTPVGSGKRQRAGGATNVEELERAFEFPWDKWTIFLHPEQRQWVAKEFNGPARVSGSAGTGKTIVALHRAVHLARENPDARVLLATFSTTLANALRTKLRRLVSGEPRLGERIDVDSLNAIGLRLYKARCWSPRLATREGLLELLAAASRDIGRHKFSLSFLMAEWDQVVDAWQLTDWEGYRDVARLGRKTRLPEASRKTLWSVFENLRSRLKEAGRITLAEVFAILAALLAQSKNPPFEFVVIDEAQDISIPQLRFLGALRGNRPNGLFFSGDLGQRIFQQPFSWKSLGVDVRGRSWNLRVNYRTSHQIRKQADRLLGPGLTDLDGNHEERSDTISIFNGPPPVICIFTDEAEELAAVRSWVGEQVSAGVLPHEIGLFVRSAAQLSRARAAVEAAELPFMVLDDQVEATTGHLSISTTHLAKGLEFRAVIVMACDDEVMPLQERIETVGDDADLQEVYDTERHLLYVACTRARDSLMVTAVEPGSEFLDDLLV